MLNILEYDQLKDILPHTYPFLLIDRVIDYTPGESLTAVKNITANEWSFGGFGQTVPREAGGLSDSRQLSDVGSQSKEMEIFPETLLIEAAAQAAFSLDLSKRRA